MNKTNGKPAKPRKQVRISVRGGVAYVDFLAPGLLAGTIFQVAVNESTYPVMARIKWMRTYWAMLATPLDIDDVLIGHLGWSALRGGW